MPASEKQTRRITQKEMALFIFFSAVSAHKRSKWDILYSIHPLDSSVCCPLATEINMAEYGSCCKQREVLVNKSTSSSDAPSAVAMRFIDV